MTKYNIYEAHSKITELENKLEVAVDMILDTHEGLENEAEVMESINEQISRKPRKDYIHED